MMVKEKLIIKMYLDTEQTLELSEKYDVEKYQCSPPDSHGSWEAEMTAEVLLRFYADIGRVTGVEERLLKKSLQEKGCCFSPRSAKPGKTESIDLMIQNGCMERKRDGKGAYIFATEELLKRQEVPLKKEYG